MAERLRDKVAIVVGAGQSPGETIGNGRATALLFARDGARVLLTDNRLDSAQETCAMIEQEGGAIVSMASMAGWIGSSDGEAHYSAAKAGVMGLTRAVAAEVGKYGIRVNAIAPGLIYNEFLERIYPKEFFERFAKRVPLGRVGEPPDVADLVLFLASDMSRYITGEVVSISGGSVMVP